MNKKFTAFLMAAALAYLLSGWVSRLASAGVPRALAVLLVEVVFMVLVLSLAALVIALVRSRDTR